MMKTIDKILYAIVAPFIFGAGFIIGWTQGTIRKLRNWKERTK